MIDALERILNDLIASQHGLITRRQALVIGATASQINRRLQRGRWVRAERGLYREATAPTTPLQRVMLAVLSVGPEAAASHQTAADLWDLLGYEPPIVHVSTTRPRWRSRTYVVHRSSDLARHHISDVHGIPTTDVARTIVDLGATAGRRTVETVLDSAVRKKLVTTDEVQRLIDEVARQGRAGVAFARELVAERAGWEGTTESELEDQFRRVLEQSGLPLPTPQFEVRNDFGDLLARVDFAYPQQRIVVELDGFVYHTDPAAFVRDRSRQNQLLMAGYRVLRYTHADVSGRPEAVALQVRQALSDQ